MHSNQNYIKDVKILFLPFIYNKIMHNTRSFALLFIDVGTGTGVGLFYSLSIFFAFFSSPFLRRSVPLGPKPIKLLSKLRM
ncbi:hypothetical protein GYMLUDRAFT_100281 [Collybiopsis luxurians FD-317 M1]|uniref:Uncharacterized protein n=1 Tax=Collybiopsis luxurians FD-317 M1 TaxID=944289 RepID=A0A0D0CGC6_9AGAR|nr:hypothetical protein GYMLUDRAFT_100281 [Collybiopsis luxurians FD-317 M1]